MYTLTVRNNQVRATGAIELVDYLPAGLEFLGCGGDPDHTTDAATNRGSSEEYPGSGAIVVRPVDDCLAPRTVETVRVDPDGDGALPEAVYTKVTWDVGALAADGRRTISYRAAVPIRENLTTWTGAEPGTGGAQAANLDNNAGPETRDEQELTNYAVARGRYDDRLDVGDEVRLTRTAEDWVVHKQADHDELRQGALTWWTLTFETSEYRSVRNATVTETVPNGLCPLGPVNYTAGGSDDDDCRPTGEQPDFPYADVTEHGDGTFTVTWDETTFGQLAQTAVDDRFTLRFPTRTRSHWQRAFADEGPILTRDTVENKVATEATAVVRRDADDAEIPHDDGNGTGTLVPDASRAGQIASRPSIEKLVADAASVAAAGGDCRLVDWVRTVPTYHPGDRVCWKLHVSFPAGVDTSPLAIRDFLPPGASFEPGREGRLDPPYGANVVDATFGGDDGGVLGWTVDSGTVPTGALVFERWFSTIVEPAGAQAVDGEVLGNLMKFSSRNTAGESEALRDARDVELETPVVRLAKGVASVERPGRGVVAGPFDPAVDHRPVQASDRVTYRIVVRNDGGQDAQNVEVWDLLPPEHRCIAISGYDPVGGVCGPDGRGGERIEWTIPQIAAGASASLTYTAVVPDDIGPARTIANTAGVRYYGGRTNLGGEYPYHPVGNVDPSVTDPNAPAAIDQSDVYTGDAAIAKSRAVVHVGGATDPASATIGETIDYTVRATIPAGTTLGADARIDDLLDDATRQTYVPGSATAVRSDGGAVTLDDSGSAPVVTLPTPLKVDAGGDDLTVTVGFTVRVADVAANTRRAGALQNVATVRWTDPVENLRTRTSLPASTTIVEPNLSQTKADDTGGARVVPGRVVTYTVRTTNSGSRTSTAYGVLVADVVPAGLTPIGADGQPLDDGDPVPGSAGPAVWDRDASTISETVPALAAGATHTLSYRVVVDDRAVGGKELTNTVTARAQSLPDGATGLRTGGDGYAAGAQDTVRIEGALVRKTVDRPTATVGEHAGYTLRVTVPAQVQLYDVTVTDLLPAALAYDGYDGATCVSGCAGYVEPQEYDAQPAAGGATTIAWDLGDIADPLAEPLVIDIAYRAHVREETSGSAAVTAGDSAVNVATVASNRSSLVDGFDPTTIPTGHQDVSPQTSATVTVTEPSLSLDKRVKVGGGSYGDGPATARSDDALAYAITVVNDGDAPAYDVTVRDVPDAALTDVEPEPEPRAEVTDEWRADDRAIAWQIAGPIAPGDSVTLRYSARLADAAGLTDGQQVDNTASAPLAYGRPAAERSDAANVDVDYRRYDGGSDTARVVLDFPALSLAKTTGLGAGPAFPESGNAEVGQPFPWRVTVANGSATATARAVVVRDVLPPNWRYEPGSATLDGSPVADPVPTADPAGDRLEWTVASVAPGGAATIAYRAILTAAAGTTPGTGAGANVNRAEVIAAQDEAGNAGNGDGPYRTGPDEATATLRLPQLTIAKTPDGGAAVAGTPSSFAIEVSNDGPVAARDVTIRDLLPAGIAYRAGDATASPSTGFAEQTPSAGPGAGETTVVWTVAELPAGETVTITVPVAVDPSVADGATLVNHAEAGSDELPGPVGDDGSLDVSARADLSIAKDGAPTYVPGEQHTWTLRVRNAGPSHARDVVVSDPLPAGTSFVSADGRCTHAAGTVSCALGTVPVGYDETFAVTVRVDPDATGPLANTATVATSTDDPDHANDSATHTPDDRPIADVTVEDRADPEAIARGHRSTLTLTASNLGPSVARTVVLRDELPSGLRFVAVDDDRCTEASGTISCPLGDLAVGEREVVRVTVSGEREGEWTDDALVTTTTTQPPGGGAPDRDDATIAVGPVADLGLVKRGPAAVAAGGRIVWRLEATNHGGDDATGVTIVDTLPAGTVFAGADDGCSEAGGTVTCAIGDLAVGASAVREIAATAPVALASTTVVNAATVHGDQLDENPGNDRDEAATEIGPSADLAIVKQGPAEAAAGGTAAWTLLVVNHGPSAASGVTVADALPDGVAFVSAAPSQGACSAAGQLVSCALGTLAPGASAQVQVVGRVAAELEGATVVNAASVSGEQPDPNPSNDRGELPTRVGPPEAGDFDLALEKRLADGARPALGAGFAYELTVANAGPAKAEAVTVADTLPRALKARTAKVAGGRCTIRGQLVSCALGTLAAGERRTVALRVTALKAGTIRNVATVAARVADRDAANDRATATVRIAQGRAALRLSKRVVGGARADRGGTVRYRIRVTNRSRRAAAGVVVCDRLPRGLAVRSTGGGRMRRGQLCWTVGLLRPQASRAFAFRARVLADARGPRLVNVATATAANARRRSARAVVRIPAVGDVLPTAARGGGVTG